MDTETLYKVIAIIDSKTLDIEELRDYLQEYIELQISSIEQ
jgi:hypothetical protein